MSGKIYEYDLRQPGIILSEPIHQFSVGEDEINMIDVDRRGKFLAVADDSGEPALYDLVDRRRHPRRFRKGHVGNICASVCFQPVAPYDLWTGGMDMQQLQWDSSRAILLGRWANPPPPPPSSSSSDATNANANSQLVNPPFVYSLAVHPKGHQVAAGLGNGAIRVVEFMEQPPFNNPGMTGKKDTTATTQTKQGKKTKGKNAKAATITVAQPEWREHPSLVDTHAYAVSALAYAQFDPSWLVSGGLDGQLGLWRAKLPDSVLTSSSSPARVTGSQGDGDNDDGGGDVSPPLVLVNKYVSFFDKVECLTTADLLGRSAARDKSGDTTPGSRLVALGGVVTQPDLKGAIALYRFGDSS
ncbi:hypothetical protein BJ085DRAFT_36321 [Dimargaris cristalligena]|uniref:Uncharacterized protein n=1 Tax=Dimargaris cristalligena TaxID=215637 RepID=A0A4P9ZTK8_9FUNG|nr:hypothetical protein BJ085DRAFT_36321 [Dimargaris cristalligena]|eukprot:RKP35870.1 hypothetical protein BJ085DRAFT_36321 [Dimargaris cristalligena]